MAGKTSLEFINAAPCPVSIDAESFFGVDLNHAEVRRHLNVPGVAYTDKACEKSL